MYVSFTGTRLWRTYSAGFRRFLSAKPMTSCTCCYHTPKPTSPGTSAFPYALARCWPLVLTCEATCGNTLLEAAHRVNVHNTTLTLQTAVECTFLLGLVRRGDELNKQVRPCTISHHGKHVCIHHRHPNVMLAFRAWNPTITQRQAVSRRNGNIIGSVQRDTKHIRP